MTNGFADLSFDWTFPVRWYSKFNHGLDAVWWRYMAHWIIRKKVIQCAFSLAHIRNIVYNGGEGKAKPTKNQVEVDHERNG